MFTAEYRAGKLVLLQASDVEVYKLKQTACMDCLGSGWLPIWGTKNGDSRDWMPCSCLERSV